jgi:LmbE family N-acetylglucosaminyl deacetylase
VDFLDGRDTRVAEQPDLAAQLQRALESVRYQRVFCPWPQEQHPDHAATYVFYRQAVSRLSYPLDTWLYEVWTPLRPTMLVPIDAFIEEKLAAIRAHRSQLAQLDYAGAFRGLAAWRALACPPSRFAEAFCICDRDTLISGSGRGTAALAS